MDPFSNRLIFAVSVLKQEEYAEQILGDLLEEEGERALADWARASKKAWHKRLDFVLGILPHRLTLKISSEFLYRSLNILAQLDQRTTYAGGTDSSSMESIVRAVSTIRDWAAGKPLSSQNLPKSRLPLHEFALSPDLDIESPEAQTQLLGFAIHLMTDVWSWRYGIKDIDLIMQTFHVAVTSSLHVLQNANDPKVHVAVDASRSSCRKVTKATLNMLKPFQVPEIQRMASGPGQRYPNPLAQWQMEFAIKTIEAELG
jgi:hypothetical protein